MKKWFEQFKCICFVLILFWQAPFCVMGW